MLANNKRVVSDIQLGDTADDISILTNDIIALPWPESPSTPSKSPPTRPLST